jgi:hypothetical protein
MKCHQAIRSGGILFIEIWDRAVGEIPKLPIQYFAQQRAALSEAKLPLPSKERPPLGGRFYL